jgi:hypothetical protein
VEGRHRSALLAGDAVVVPVIRGRSKAALLALRVNDGSELWRTTIPFEKFADSIEVRVEPAKNGYLVHIDWLVLD